MRIHFTSDNIINPFVKNAHSFEHCINHKIIEKKNDCFSQFNANRSPLKRFCAYESCIEMVGWAFTSWPCTLINTQLKCMGLTWMHAGTNLLKWIRGGVHGQELAKCHSNYCTILFIAFDIILESSKSHRISLLFMCRIFNQIVHIVAQWAMKGLISVYTV